MTNLLVRTSTTSTRQDVALLLGRLALGVVLIAHGWQKFFSFGLSGAAASFEQMASPRSSNSSAASR